MSATRLKLGSTKKAYRVAGEMLTRAHVEREASRYLLRRLFEAGRFVDQLEREGRLTAAELERIRQILNPIPGARP